MSILTPIHHSIINPNSLCLEKSSLIHWWWVAVPSRLQPSLHEGEGRLTIPRSRQFTSLRKVPGIYKIRRAPSKGMKTVSIAERKQGGHVAWRSFSDWRNSLKSCRELKDAAFMGITQAGVSLSVAQLPLSCPCSGAEYLCSDAKMCCLCVGRIFA